MAFGPIISWQIDEEKVETVADFIFLGSKKINSHHSLWMVNTATKVKDVLAPWKKSYDQPRQCIK